MTQTRIKRRERDTIIQALRAGVVPKTGLKHIQVGRAREIEETVHDIERIEDAGASIRFIIGEYGSGKTFFLNLVRLVALEKGMVVMAADLTPTRRLHATGGQARSLFAEMTHNLSTRTKPEGGALASVVERFVTQAEKAAHRNGRRVEEVIHDRLSRLEDYVGGYDFATVAYRYWQGHEMGNDQLKSDALRWLRAEISTRTDARRALRVRNIIDDASLYDHVKLYSAFVRVAGYRGLVVVFDEMVNLHRLTHSRTRNANYEQILRILNDVLQGGASHLGFLMGGTSEFLTDTRRGLYSNAALRSRLTENTFAREGLVDLSGPVIRLTNLSPEDLYVLLENIRRVFAAGEQGADLIPDQGLHAFMTHCSERVGDAYFRTPRNTVKEFVNLLSVIEQNPGTDWRQFIGDINVDEDQGDDLSSITDAGDGQATAGDDDDELEFFRL